MSKFIASQNGVVQIEDILVESTSISYTDIGPYEEQFVLDQLQEKTDWREVVSQLYAETRPWLYKIITSPRRAGILSLLELESVQNCLDIGSGWGQLTIPLARQTQVHALDQTLNRIKILREIAGQENVQLNFYVGDFLTFPFAEISFDLILMNGSLEYMGLGHEEVSTWECQVQALQKAGSLLTPQGQLYVGIENALGLKYLMGAPDDHTGIPYQTLAYGPDPKVKQQVCVWRLSQYLELFRLANLQVQEIYACFPDYKLPEYMVPLTLVDLFLQNRWPQLSEHSGFDGQPVPFESALRLAYYALAQEKIVKYFVPSFGFILSKPSQKRID